MYWLYGRIGCTVVSCAGLIVCFAIPLTFFLPVMFLVPRGVTTHESLAVASDFLILVAYPVQAHHGWKVALTKPQSRFQIDLSWEGGRGWEKPEKKPNDSCGSAFAHLYRNQL